MGEQLKKCPLEIGYIEFTNQGIRNGPRSPPRHMEAIDEDAEQVLYVNPKLTMCREEMTRRAEAREEVEDVLGRRCLSYSWSGPRIR